MPEVERILTYNSCWLIWFDKEILSDWCGEVLHQQLQHYYKCDLRLKRWILSNNHMSNVIYTALLNHNYGYYYENTQGKQINKDS